MSTKFRARSELGWIWGITGILWVLNALIHTANGVETLEIWVIIVNLFTALIAFLDAYMFFSKKNYLLVTHSEVVRSIPFRQPRVIPTSDLISANIIKKGIGKIILIETKEKALKLSRGYYDASPVDIVKSIQAVLPNRVQENTSETIESNDITD